MRLPVEQQYQIPIDEIIERLQKAKEDGDTHLVCHLAIYGYETCFVQETQKIEPETDTKQK
jgi:hypothetical protein